MEMIAFDKEIHISISSSINIGSSQTHIQWSGDGCMVGTWRPWAGLDLPTIRFWYPKAKKAEKAKIIH